MGCKLLSLDTSSTSTGWALFVDGKYKDSGCIAIKNTQDKMYAMVSKLLSLIETIQPDIVVAEEMVVTRNAQVARNLTMILGAIYGKCIQMIIDWYTLRPTEWRKLIDSGSKPRKRNEYKAWSLQKVKDLFGIIDINDDVSDAILIGQAYINMFSDRSG